jgi:hypothetical protein
MSAFGYGVWFAAFRAVVVLHDVQLIMLLMPSGSTRYAVYDPVDPSRFFMRSLRVLGTLKVRSTRHKRARSLVRVRDGMCCPKCRKRWA